MIRSAVRSPLATRRLGGLRAAALVDDHLRQVPLDYVGVRAVVDERHGGEFERCAAWLHTCQSVHLAVLLDHVRVVIRKGVGRPVARRAVPSAVVRVVTEIQDESFNCLVFFY